MDKIDSRTLPVDALNERRRRAMKMRLDETSLKATAAQCEISRTTMIAAVKAYEAGGWKAVDVDRGSGRTLTVEQEREIQRLIRDRTPDQLKMVYALWTRQAVAVVRSDLRYALDSTAFREAIQDLQRDAERRRQERQATRPGPVVNQDRPGPDLER